MADFKNFGQKGLGTDVQLGKKGPRIIKDGTENIRIRNATDTAFVNVKVADPNNPEDAATKAYVDAVATGLDIKASVRTKTDGSETNAFSTWTPSGSGVGKTLTSPDNALSNNTIGGVSLSLGDRVLVTTVGGSDTTPDLSNGVYTITQLADGTTNPTVLTRATDADEDSNAGGFDEFTAGLFTFVEEGTHARQGWVLVTAEPITIDTTAVQFTKFSDADQQDPGFRTTTLDTTASQNIGTPIPTGSFVQRVKLKVTTAYSTGATIAIGDGTNTYMTIDENDAEETGVYIADLPGDTVVAGGGQLVATIGGAPGAGAATVRVSYEIPG